VWSKYSVVLNSNFPHRIQPAYHPISEPYEIDGRHIFVIWCPGGQHRPYKAAESLSKDNRAFHYYIRRHSSTVRAKEEDERELMSLAARIPFATSKAAWPTKLRTTRFRATARLPGHWALHASDNVSAPTATGHPLCTR
jgi:hypothetical protein